MNARKHSREHAGAQIKGKGINLMEKGLMPAEVMEEIEFHATAMSSVLAGICRKGPGIVRWGINE